MRMQQLQGCSRTGEMTIFRAGACHFRAGTRSLICRGRRLGCFSRIVLSRNILPRTHSVIDQASFHVPWRVSHKALSSEESLLGRFLSSKTRILERIVFSRRRQSKRRTREVRSRIQSIPSRNPRVFKKPFPKICISRNRIIQLVILAVSDGYQRLSKFIHTTVRAGNVFDIMFLRAGRIGDEFDPEI